MKCYAHGREMMHGVSANGRTQTREGKEMGRGNPKRDMIREVSRMRR